VAILDWVIRKGYSKKLALKTMSEYQGGTSHVEVRGVKSFEHEMEHSVLKGPK
jgi:hypothetical protein